MKFFRKNDHLLSPKLGIVKEKPNPTVGTDNFKKANDTQWNFINFEHLKWLQKKVI